MTNTYRSGQSKMAPFEGRRLGSNLTTLGKLLNTDTQAIVLYERMAQVPEEDRDSRLVDAESYDLA